MSIEERHHAPLRLSFQIIKYEAPGTNDTDAFQMAVKSVNDSTGPHIYVPSLLVYESLPPLGLPTDKPTTSIHKRAAAVRKATSELSKRFARRQIRYGVRTVLRTRNGANVSSIHVTCLGQPV